MIQYNQPDKYEETFAMISDELFRLSQRLYELLPDPSLGPAERLERLARVVPESTRSSAQCRSARSKLNALRLRLAELVPEPTLSPAEKLQFLVEFANQLVPQAEMKLVEKLELIGDRRALDCLENDHGHN